MIRTITPFIISIFLSLILCVMVDCIDPIRFQATRVFMGMLAFFSPFIGAGVSGILYETKKDTNTLGDSQ